MTKDKILSFIGLAKKAGKIYIGEFQCENLIKSRKAKLVIVADDASFNTKKLFTNKCKYYNVPIYFYSSKEEFGKNLGTSVKAVIAFEDENFVEKIICMLTEIENG